MKSNIFILRGLFSKIYHLDKERKVPIILKDVLVKFKKFKMKIANNQIDNYIKNIDKEKVAGALLFGADESVAMSRFNAIAKKIVADLKDQFLVVDLDKERFASNSSCLADEFFSISMFGGRKLIIVRNPALQVSKALKIFLEDEEQIKKSDNFILILASELEKSNLLRKICENSNHFAAIACYEDSDLIIKKLIEQRLKSANIEFDNEILRHLFEILPRNRQIIASEIDKIATYLDGEEISAKKIDEIVKNQSEVKIDEFIDFFVMKNKKEALNSLQSLFQDGFEPILALRFLTNYLLKIYEAKNAIENGENFDFVVKSQNLFFKIEPIFKKHLRSVEAKEVANWLNSLQNLEIQLKTNFSKNAKLLFSQYVLS